MATMDDALRTFVIEARELLDQMEQALLTIEQSHIHEARGSAAGADPFCCTIRVMSKGVDDEC